VVAADVALVATVLVLVADKVVARTAFKLVAPVVAPAVITARVV
jgi:hypothetical protein